MWRQRTVSVASADVVLTSLADCSGSVAPRITARPLPVVAQRRMLRSVVALGHSVRGRPIRAIVLGDPNAPRPVRVVGCIHGNETAGITVADRLAAGPPPRRSAVWIIRDLNPTVSPQAPGKTLTTSISTATSRSAGGLSAMPATAIRRTTGTLRARESPRPHADPSPPPSAHNLVSSAPGGHRPIRRRRPNRSPLRRPQPTTTEAATALSRRNRPTAYAEPGCDPVVTHPGLDLRRLERRDVAMARSQRRVPRVARSIPDAHGGAVEEGLHRWFFRFDARYTTPRPVLDATAAGKQR